MHSQNLFSNIFTQKLFSNSYSYLKTIFKLVGITKYVVCDRFRSNFNTSHSHDHLIKGIDLVYVDLFNRVMYILNKLMHVFQFLL